MAETYLITFKPVGRFYFGTSQSFSEGFFARSSHFPPQTTLLGALRFSLLKQNNLLDGGNRYPKKNGAGVVDDVKKLTGEASMQSINEEVGSGNYFGTIKKISPVFICQQKTGDPFPKDFFFPVPFDVIYKRYENERDENGEKKIIGLERIFVNEYSDKSGIYSAKRTKEFSADSLGNNLFWETYFNNNNLELSHTIRYKEVFVDDSQPGISRERENIATKRTAIEGKFYIKKDYRLHKDFSFGIVVHFTQEFNLKNDDVFLGGERSLFKMTFIKINEQNIGVLQNHSIMKRFLGEKDFGDFDGSKKINLEKESKLVFISPFFGAGKIDGVAHSVINEIYSPRMIGADSRKTDTYNVIPSRSIIYTNGVLKIENTFPMPKLMGYNFAIKF